MSTISGESNFGIWNAYIPTFTGFSADPGSVTARYSIVGKICSVYINMTAGTSNAATFTLTLPYAAANTSVQTVIAWCNDNGTGKAAYLRTRVNSNIADISRDTSNPATLTGWTASGNKSVLLSFEYETA